MLPHKLPSASSTQITISSAALNIRDAIRAADSPTSDNFEIPEGANRAIIQVETNDLRYLTDGNTPTTSLGLVANAGNGFTLDGDLTKLLMIRDGGSDVTATIQLFTVYRGEH